MWCDYQNVTLAGDSFNKEICEVTQSDKLLEQLIYYYYNYYYYYY